MSKCIKCKDREEKILGMCMECYQRYLEEN